MNIIVCVKEVSDPDAPLEDFTIDSSTNKLVASKRVAKVLNPFDLQAVEAALRIKDETGAKVTILNMGHNPDMVAVREPLTMGADELVLLEDSCFAHTDSWSTGKALSSAILKIGDFDLILCGRQSADQNAGQVGPGIAEILDIPSITMAQKVETIEGKLIVERVTNDGYEIVEGSIPALVTVTSELGLPRYPSILRIRQADKIEPVCWNSQDINFDPEKNESDSRIIEVLKLYQELREGECEYIEGDSIEVMAANLALKLRKEKLI